MPAPRIDPTRLETHVRVLAETFVPRDWHHPENLDRAAAYIREELERTGGRTEEQLYQVGGRTYRNVLTQFGPETSGTIRTSGTPAIHQRTGTVVGAQFIAPSNLRPRYRPSSPTRQPPAICTPEELTED
jgi:hypothetical protein